jgi:uncharacterized membrane protein YhaH (DUF805 family)
MANIQTAYTTVANVDVRPVLPVSHSALLDRAVVIRDHFAATIARVLEEEKVRASLLKSDSGNYPAWIRLEAWLPVGVGGPTQRQRCELELIVETRPFHRQSLICGARLKQGKRTIHLAGCFRFTERDVEEWSRYAIGRGPRPPNYRPLLDKLRDKVALLVPPLSPRYNPIDRQFRAPAYDVRTAIGAAACALVVAGLIDKDVLVTAVFAVAGLTVLTAVYFIVSGRRYRLYDLVVPQSKLTPRHLGHVDSWHAVLVGLGGAAPVLTARLIARFEDTDADDLDVHREWYGYRISNGYEERERLVLSHRQAHVHVHVHTDGDNLFVGWQALLNWAQWRETSPVTTLEDGDQSVVFRDVAPGWYYPDLFDLIELNSLSDTVHTAIEREVKSLLTEHGIDQQVDFEILRGDRDNALDARQTWPDRPNRRERNSNIIFGWGGARRASAGEMQLVPIDVKPAGRSRGIAKVPAVVMLPLIAAVGYAWLYLSDSTAFWQFQQALPSGYTFTSYPLFYLPLGVALAVGLWLYAGVSLVHAVLALTLFETALLSTGIALFYSPAIAPVAAAFPATSTIRISLCFLTAAAIWAPSLRYRLRWIVALVLWPLWSAESSLVTNQIGELNGAAFASIVSLEVFMAASCGFWLWRDECEHDPRLAAPRKRQRKVAPKVTPQRQVAESPGATKYPAAMVVPVVAALGYFLLYRSDAIDLGGFQQDIAPDFSFSFYPMFYLPFAVALGLGLWRYSTAGLVGALIFLAAAEAVSFGTTYAYYYSAPNIVDPDQLNNFADLLLFNAGITAVSGFGYLALGAIWLPRLRSVKLWVAATALWAIWTVAAYVAYRDLELEGAAATAVVWSIRVFMAACFGFWLSNAQPRSGESGTAGRRIDIFLGLKGRVGRRTFWLAITAVAAVQIAAQVGIQALEPLAFDNIQPDRLSAFVSLAFAYPEFAIAVKRGHDRNRPAWQIGIFFIAGAMLDVSDILGQTNNGNPSIMTLAIAVPFVIFGFFLLNELGFQKGTGDANRYGSDPLANRYGSDPLANG